MIKLTRQINSLLTSTERKQALSVFCLTTIMALMEVVGIASILPFMAVLASPDIVQTNQYLKQGYEFFGFDSVNRYLFFLGLLVLLTLILNNSVKALTRWKTLDFSIMSGHTISSRLLRQYLHQPYAYFLSRNSAHLNKNVLDETGRLVTNVIVPLAEVVARLITILSILALIMYVDPVLALSAAIILGGAFGGVYLVMRKWLLTKGRERMNAQGQRYQIVNEALSGIKNVKLTGNEDTYSTLFENPSRIYAKTTASSSMAGEIPRYALEIIGFGGILFIILYLLLQKQGLSHALPLVTLYAFAGYRLMPSFQVWFQSYTRIRFHTAVLDTIEREMIDTSLDPQSIALIHADTPALPFDQKIEFKDVSFQYELGARPIISKLNFTLNKNTSVGIVGKTGSGKTTMVDLLLGLLTPTSGEILIDGVALNDKTRRSWQKNCAYVTQHIYLCDDTVRANIAFGVSPENIDDGMVRQAAKMAALDAFVENDLPHGYDTIVGENGIRLSGGQRQRIGLARALYLNRPILVLDEATSALDTDTENEVMQAVSNFSKQKTVIMIAHRLSTIEKCEQILSLDSAAKNPHSLTE